MKHWSIYLCITGLMLGLNACNHSGRQAESSEQVDSVTISQGRSISDVSVEEVERIYYNKGGYNFNVAGYEFTFTEYLEKTPATMHYPFTELQQAEENPLRITDSPDGKIRFYGWDSGLGGTCISWTTMYQIEHKGKVYTYNGLPDWDGEGVLPMNIYKMPHKSRDLYVFIYYFREWSSQGYNVAVGYELKGHTLKQIPLFVDQDATRHSKLDYEYNIPDYYFRMARAIGFDYQFYYDDQSATLYYPQARIKAGESLILSDRYIPYTWDRDCLLEGEETGNPNLIRSLQDYKHVERMVRFVSSATIIARIDVMPDGSYRYAAWLNEPMSETPAMLLYNGMADEKRYYFRNKTHIYVITKEEIPVLEVYYSADPYELGEMYMTEESVSYEE